MATVKDLFTREGAHLHKSGITVMAQHLPTGPVAVIESTCMDMTHGAICRTLYVAGDQGRPQESRWNVARKISLNLGPGSVEWEPSSQEEGAAWEAYVELSTRVSGTPVEDPGLIRESLQSLHNLFRELRRILRERGPEIARQKASAGAVIIGLLNGYLRPFLAEWHPALSEWESARGSTTSVVAHERAWGERERFVAALANLYGNLDAYRNALAQIAGVVLP